MDAVSKQKVIVIVGQTGSGKTNLSLAIATRFNGEVINADSRQVYKKLDIGTEKIQQSEMEGVPHHLLDVADVKKVFTAIDFQKHAQKAIREIASRNHVPIIAGGTFFYIDTLLGKTSIASVAPNPELRKKLDVHDEATLFSMLEQKDPQRAANIDRHNKRRLLRALEILSELPQVPQQAPTQSAYDSLTIGISVDKKALRERLRARAESALERGLIEETKNLIAEGVPRERLREIGLEYRIILEHLDGLLTKEQLLEKLEQKNWQYAKRQMAWLKRDDTIQWFDANDTDAIFQTVASFLNN